MMKYFMADTLPMPNLDSGNITFSVVVHKLNSTLKRYRAGTKGAPNAPGIRIAEPCNINPSFPFRSVDLNELFPIEHCVLLTLL